MFVLGLFRVECGLTIRKMMGVMGDGTLRQKRKNTYRRKKGLAPPGAESRT
jgi:hypothetical protein